MVTSALGKNSNTYVFNRLHRITLFCSSQLIIMEGRKEEWKEGRKGAKERVTILLSSHHPNVALHRMSEECLFGCMPIPCSTK